MKNYLFVPASLLILITACKEKGSKSDEGTISAISIIKGQLHELDTSLYQFSKIEIKSIGSDTFFLKRGEVRGLAEPFLSVPDITTDNYTKKYKEDRLIDAEQQTLNITSTAKDEDAEVQTQIIIAALADLSSGKVKSIYIDRYLPSADSTLEQKLFWEIDKSFLVTNIIQRENKPEEVRRIKVEWQ